MSALVERLKAAAAMTDDRPPAAYPLPQTDDDSRFSFGLVLDVAEVLERHGYPRPAAGADWVELQQALWRFLYVPHSS